jgi:hypothetical protein
LPFQLSANATGTPLLVVCPTAVQAELETHDIPDRRLSPPLGLGVVWIAQALPFHCSASVTKVPLLPEDPTAVQAVALVHDTPASLFWIAIDPLPGLGVGWITQLEPFQASATVSTKPLRKKNPTAVQAVADVHDTALNTVCTLLTTFGDAWIDQLVPFHRSTKVRVALLVR